jgi:salicylate hydroxylase
MSIHVLIAGGGLGGLCLAQGLRKHGVSVAVYEREGLPTAAKGYRIHINQAGSRALRNCLPDDLWQAFVTTAGVQSAGLGFITEQLNDLLFLEQRRIEGKSANAPADPVTSEHPVSRAALRQVLLGGLQEVVNFGKELTRYEAAGDGVTAVFDDGTSARGDVLVAADGIGSRVRQQYLPHAKVVDTGIVAIGGQVPLDARTREWIPEPFVKRLNNVLPPRGCGMFIAQYLNQLHQPTVDATTRLEPPIDCLRDHVFWAFIAKRGKYPADADLRTLAGAVLQTMVGQMMPGWHPDLLRLVSEADPESVAAFRVQTSEAIEPWRPTRVTLLGDAIHAMTPLQGLGGNTAFRDAALLCRLLVEVEHGQTELIPAIEAYERAMTAYGFDAVRQSRKIAELAVSDDGFGRAIFKTVLRVANQLPPLKQKMFGAPQHGS